MHMKLLAEETLIVGEYPTGTLDGPQIEANLQYVLSNFNSKWGTPFKVIRIPMPPNTSSGGYSQWSPYMTYANSIFVNKTILIPTYYEEYDTTAQRIYENALPGYKVIGIDCNSIIPSGGALHCITHEIGVKDPLLISYQHIPDTSIDGSVSILDIPFDVHIRHRSGISSATLYYSKDTTAGYSQVPLQLTDSVAKIWSATLSISSPSGKIFYYVKANSVSGKTMYRPMPGSNGPSKFTVTINLNIQDILFESLNIYPNPASAITCIELERNQNGRLKIQLFDLAGKKIMDIEDAWVGFGVQRFFFDASGLKTGTYILRLEGSEGIHSERIVVHH